MRLRKVIPWSTLASKNFQISNPKQYQMTETTKRYDLENRTLKFARAVSEFVNRLPKAMQNAEYSRQLVRSSGSVGANYIEANESLDKKDFLMRIRICRKESKESRYWLELVSCKEWRKGEVGEAYPRIYWTHEDFRSYLGEDEAAWRRNIRNSKYEILKKYQGQISDLCFTPLFHLDFWSCICFE